MNILEEIVRNKSRKIIKRERNKNLISFSDALLNKNKLGRLALISEIKPRSPSQGNLRKVQNPITLAKIMQDNGATAISILTKENYFGGCIENLIDVSNEIKLPLLRKDFITSAEEIDEAYNCNADAILLIVALLKKNTGKLFEKCIEVGLDALVEVHTSEELQIAVDIGARIIGINNRDLTTLKTNLKTTERLIQSVPKKTIVISESGVRNKADAEYLASLGANAVLVGSSLMQSSDLSTAIKELSEVLI